MQLISKHTNFNLFSCTEDPQKDSITFHFQTNRNRSLSGFACGGTFNS